MLSAAIQHGKDRRYKLGIIADYIKRTLYIIQRRSVYVGTSYSLRTGNIFCLLSSDTGLVFYGFRAYSA